MTKETKLKGKSSLGGFSLFLSEKQTRYFSQPSSVAPALVFAHGKMHQRFSDSMLFYPEKKISMILPLFPNQFFFLGRRRRRKSCWIFFFSFSKAIRPCYEKHWLSGIIKIFSRVNESKKVSWQKSQALLALRVFLQEEIILSLRLRLWEVLAAVKEKGFLL